MTNTQIMELLRNEAINEDTKKALLIAAGIILVGSIAVYYYYNNQENKFISLNTRHDKYVNFSDSRIKSLSTTINQKDGLIAEQVAQINKLENEYMVLQNINNRLSTKA